MTEKPDHLMDMLLGYQAKITGGILNTPEIALQFAELILRNTKQMPIVEQQLPLSITDQDDTWRVSGSPKITPGEPGPWQITMNKSDARVRSINDISSGVPTLLSE